MRMRTHVGTRAARRATDIGVILVDGGGYPKRGEKDLRTRQGGRVKNNKLIKIFVCWDSLEC
jgi:hypothetical protein